MKKLLAILIATALMGCSSVKPVNYSVNAPCLDTMLFVIKSDYEPYSAGLGLTVLTALREVGLSTSTANVEYLAEECVNNSDLSFLEAAAVVKNKHSI